MSALGLIVTEYAGGGQTHDLAVRPDGTAAFTDSSGAIIGRIGPSGDTALYRLPSGAEHTFGITCGPKDLWWFTEWSNGPDNRISCIAADGSAYDYLPLEGLGTPRNVVASDEDVYFTVGSKLGCLSVNHMELRVFPFPEETAWRQLEATPLVLDGKGGVWVGFGGAGSYLGRFDLKSETWESVELPPLQPTAMTIDRHGDLWFTCFANNQIGRLALDRDLAVWEHGGNPFGITATPGGDIWVSEFSGNRITQVHARSGDVQPSVPLPTPDSQPQNLVSDASGALWYTAQTGRVGYIGPVRGDFPSAHPITTELAADRLRLRDIAPEYVGHRGDLLPDRDPISIRIGAHPSFRAPDKDLAIWRYVDLPRLVTMLETRAVFFARLDALRDQFEGSLPLRDGTDVGLDEITAGGLDPEHTRYFLKLHREGLAIFRPRALVSCWHINDYESMAMWELYAQSGSGIAIRSSSLRLVESLTTRPNRKPGRPQRIPRACQIHRLQLDRRAARDGAGLPDNETHQLCARARTSYCAAVAASCGRRPAGCVSP
jgi:streptogramin lyase